MVKQNFPSKDDARKNSQEYLLLKNFSQLGMQFRLKTFLRDTFDGKNKCNAQMQCIPMP